MDIQSLFDRAGGATRLGLLIGVARTTVLDWKRTGFVPGNRVGQISAALGIATEEVLKLVQPGKVRIPEQSAKLSAATSKPRAKRSPAAGVTPVDSPPSSQHEAGEHAREVA